jgi:hypothetical protein
MKKCSPPLAIKEMQINTTLRVYLNPAVSVKNTTKPGKDVGRKESHTLLVGM